ncbi:MAG: GNAT family N-acetyltransferase [Pseudomonadota bacterium]
MGDTITIRTLGPDDAHVLDHVRPGVFDGDVDPAYAWAFLSLGVNVIVVGLDAGEVVGFASGTVLLHPDKPRSFFVNEIGVHKDVRLRGLASRLVRRITDVARERGCEEIWGLTDDRNKAAKALSASLGGEETSGHVMFTWQI